MEPSYSTTLLLYCVVCTVLYGGRPSLDSLLYIREQISFAVVRACTYCVFGQRAHRFSGLPFEDGGGLPALQGARDRLPSEVDF